MLIKYLFIPKAMMVILSIVFVLHVFAHNNYYAISFNESLYEIGSSLSSENAINHILVSNDSTVIFVEPCIGPIFKDEGNIGIQLFLKKNLRYPEGDNCVEGTIIIRVLIDENGHKKNIKVMKGLSPAFNEEAIRVIQLMEFDPGRCNGMPVEAYLNIPVKFKID